MAAPVYTLIDENTDLTVAPDYDPLTKDTFEDYIQINEKVNPGRRQHFNGVPNKETKDVHVVGLVLYWGKDMKKSRLRAVLNRDDIENISLYADTIIVDAKVSFPQANVTLYARRLIVGEDGCLVTTPNFFANPYATGGQAPDKMKRGAGGGKAGDITLFVQTASLPPGKTCFVLKGGDGQHGQKGGLGDEKTYKGVPVSWNTLLDKILDYDVVRGKKDNWDWGRFTGIDKLEQGLVNYVRVKVYNHWKDTKNEKSIEMGDKNVMNTNDGLDAYPSGAGGRGGRGGTLRLGAVRLGGSRADLSGGAGGRSEAVEGGPPSRRARQYHLYCHVRHIDPASEKHWPSKNVLPGASVIDSKEGKGAIGGISANGKDGGIEIARAVDPAWLHPYVLEAVVQYARDTWLAGDRKPARWLLPIYQEALRRAGAASKDLLVRNLRNEIDRLANRINDNLDYFGNPVGWVPRLSAVTNIDILRRSNPVIVQLLHYAGNLVWEEQASEQREQQLEFIVKQLKEEIDTARKNLIDAYDQLDNVKIELDKIAGQINEKQFKIRDLEGKITNELKEQEQEQIIFTGALKLAAGVCQLIPYGQPYLGEIGGGLLNNIAEIDIHSDDPFGEAMKTTSSIATDLGSFVKNNKDQISKDLTSSLTKNITSAQGDINDLDEDVGKHKKDLAACQQEVEKRFGGQLDYLRSALKGLQSARSAEEAAFFFGDDYADIVAHTRELQQKINDIEGIETTKKAELKTALSKLESEKKDLISSVKSYNAKKEKRTKGIEKATEKFEGFTKGLSSVADSMQGMMTPVNAESEEFRN